MQKQKKKIEKLNYGEVGILWLLENKGRMHVKRVAKEGKLSRNTAGKILNKLLGLNLVKLEKIGNIKFYERDSKLKNE